MRVLVTGGVRSGKSRHAEGLFAGHESVVYVAAGRAGDEDDPDWAERVRVHRERRPASWRTVETRDLPAALRDPRVPVLIDCLGTWLTGLIDDGDLWERSVEEVQLFVDGAVDALVVALEAADDVVLVTNEVGLGVVPEHRSGRLFRDLLGRVNQRVGVTCAEVHLVVAGRVLVLTEPAARPPD